MKPKLLVLTAFCLLFSICLLAQKKKKGTVAERVTCTFGDVMPDEFSSTAYSIDSTAEAVFLYDGGTSAFVGNTSGFFNVVHTVHERIRLMNKNSFSDLGKVTIYVHTPPTGEVEKMTDFEAATYNIENGKVVVTKLDKSDIFKEKDGEYTVNKFTFPNLREGSIIEYSYKLNTPGLYLPSWTFQGKYPRLYSEYDTSIPDFFDYVFLRQGYVPFAIDTIVTKRDTYNVVDGNGSSSSRTYSANTIVFNHIWAAKNVPALKLESYTTTLKNHLSKIEFQLSAIQFPDVPRKTIMHNWQEVATELMKDEDFGANISKANNFYDDDIKIATAGATTMLEKAQKIYEYVRDNFSCTETEAFYVSQPLRKTYTAKKGTVADINMLLTSMYNSIGLETHPALLSTSEHGKALEMYPILSRFNYVISYVNIDNKTYLLDASNNKLGFNHLAAECYNGFVRVINPENPMLIPLRRFAPGKQVNGGVDHQRQRPENGRFRNINQRI